jgi:hypothetical protein
VTKETSKVQGARVKTGRRLQCRVFSGDHLTEEVAFKLIGE